MSAMQKPVKAESPRALRDFLCILICWSIPVLLLRPFQNLPFVDDWVYAWSVERLLNSGELKILDISTSANPVQILWGALFCLPAGFSFVALRISTWVASVICLWGLYQLLRILGVGRAQSFIGTAALACYPVFFILSFTFMTDVPFLALFVWSSYSLIRYLNDKRPLWLIASTLLACLAVAVRLTGLPLIAASAITLIRN